MRCCRRLLRPRHCCLVLSSSRPLCLVLWGGMLVLTLSFLINGGGDGGSVGDGCDAHYPPASWTGPSQWWWALLRGWVASSGGSIITHEQWSRAWGLCCRGAWGACTSRCERASARVWIHHSATASSANPCQPPAPRDCAQGEGDCTAPPELAMPPHPQDNSLVWLGGDGVNAEDVIFVAAVLSARGNFARRRVVREQWGRQFAEESQRRRQPSRLMFLVGNNRCQFSTDVLSGTTTDDHGRRDCRGMRSQAINSTHRCWCTPWSSEDNWGRGNGEGTQQQRRRVSKEVRPVLSCCCLCCCVCVTRLEKVTCRTGSWPGRRISQREGYILRRQRGCAALSRGLRIRQFDTPYEIN
jgi:hypothetical protein